MDGNYPEPWEEEPHQRPGEKLGTGYVADGLASHRGGQADGERMHPPTSFEARMLGPLREMCSVSIRRHRNAVRRMNSVPSMVTPPTRGRPAPTRGSGSLSPPASMLGHPRHPPENDIEVGRPRPFPFVQAACVHVRSI
jgi:hypothetical protein